MTTRLYMSSSAAAAVTPAAAVNWQNPTPGLTSALLFTKDASVLALASEATSVPGAHDVLVLQAVSQPLAAQSISGTIKGQLRATAPGLADARAQLVVRVVSGDGLTVRGTLLASHTEALSSEFATSLANRKFPLAALSPATLNEVTAQAGDRLVIEVGARAIDAGSIGLNISLSVGAPSASDLPENETEAGALAPWIELSQDLSVPGATTHAGSGSIGIGIGVEL